MDSIKRLEDINNVNEGLFDKIFKSNKQSQGYLQKAKGTGYFLNGNYIHSFGTDGTLDPYSQNTWYLEKFRWLINSEFKANFIYIKNEEIEFDGDWISGEFKGLQFWGVNSFFKGGYFNGKNYSAPNLINGKGSFEIHPSRFIDGKYSDYENGILGRVDYQMPIKNVIEKMEVIRIPVNLWVVLQGGKSDKYKKVYFKVLKKIDDKSSDFVFISTFGINEFVNYENKIIKWEHIRGKNEFEYENINGFIRIGGEFNLLEDERYYLSKIQSINITNQEPVVKIEESNIIDFSEDKNLAKIFSYKGYPLKFKTTSNDEESKKKVLELKKIITNGKLYNDLEFLKYHIQPKKTAAGKFESVVDGYEDEELIYLKPVFNFIKGKKTLSTTSTGKGLMRIMKELNDVIEIVSFRTKRVIKESVKPDDILISLLKKYLNTDEYIKVDKTTSSFEKSDKEVEKKKKAVDLIKKSI